MRGFVHRGILPQAARRTRVRLTLAALLILGIALALANVGLYFALTATQNDDADAQLLAEAAAVSRQLKEVDGRVTYTGGDLPHETARGVAVDVALAGRDGILATSPDTTLTMLGHLAEPTLRTRRWWRPSTACWGASRQASTHCGHSQRTPRTNSAPPSR